VPPRKRSSDSDLGKQLFARVLESLKGDRDSGSSGALDILVGTPAAASAAAPAAMVAAPPRVALVAQDGETFVVDVSPALIGRRASKRVAPPDVDLTLSDPLQSVSRRHAWLEVDAGGARIRVEHDPPPTNPVLIEGQPVPPGETRALHDGAQVQIGLVELRFQRNVPPAHAR